jgi:hypothetical protein
MTLPLFAFVFRRKEQIMEKDGLLGFIDFLEIIHCQGYGCLVLSSGGLTLVPGFHFLE